MGSPVNGNKQVSCPEQALAYFSAAHREGSDAAYGEVTRHTRVTTQPSSKKVLKIFIRNKELIHCRKKKNSRRKEKNFDSLFLWISSFVLNCSSGKKGYFYPPFPFSTVFYPQSFCRTASYPRFAFPQPFLYNRNIMEWKEACRIGPQI